MEDNFGWLLAWSLFFRSIATVAMCNSIIKLKLNFQWDLICISTKLYGSGIDFLGAWHMSLTGSGEKPMGWGIFWWYWASKNAKLIKMAYFRENTIFERGLLLVINQHSWNWVKPFSGVYFMYLRGSEEKTTVWGIFWG